MSETLLRAQYQTIVKERDTLQNQFEELERENQELRRSVYELSLQLSQLSPTSIFQIGSKGGKWKSLELLDDNSSALIPPPHNPIDFVSSQDTRQISFKSDLKGHNGSVYCMDVSHNGKWIASGSFDKSILIWKGSFPHKQIAILMGHTQLVSAVAWGQEKVGDVTSAESTALPPVLYSSSYDKTVRIWNVLLESCIRVVKLRTFGTSITSCPCSHFFPKGCAIATTSTPYMYVIDYPDASPLHTSNTVHSVVSTSDMETLVNQQPSQTRTTSQQQPLNASTTSTGATYEKHFAVATCVAAFPDSTSVFVGDDCGGISLYALQDRGGLKLKGKHNDFAGMEAEAEGWGHEEKTSWRHKVLSMQVCDGGSSARLPTAPSQAELSASSRAPVAHTHHRSGLRMPVRRQSIILAAQFSCNMIRIYEFVLSGEDDVDAESFDWPGSPPGDASRQFRDDSFLRPLFLLGAHTTGIQWPIGLSIYMGSEFNLHVPSHEEDEVDRRRPRTLSGVVSPGYLMGPEEEADVLPAVQRVRAVEAASRNTAPPVRTRELSGTLFSPDMSEVSSQTSERPRRVRSGRIRSASDDEFGVGDVKRTGSSVIGQDDGMSEFSRDDDPDINDDDDDDDISFNSDDEDPLSAAVKAIHASTMATMNMRRNGDDGVEGGGNVFSELFMSSYKDGRAGERGVAKVPGWKKSLIVATGSSTGQVFFYDISHVNQWSPGMQSSDDKVLVAPWKVLDHAHGSKGSGKTYGAVFHPHKKCVLSFGSDHTPVVWSMTGG